MKNPSRKRGVFQFVLSFRPQRGICFAPCHHSVIRAKAKGPRCLPAQAAPVARARTRGPSLCSGSPAALLSGTQLWRLSPTESQERTWRGRAHSFPGRSLLFHGDNRCDATSRSSRGASTPDRGGILIASGVMYLCLVASLMLFHRQLGTLLAPSFLVLAVVAIASGWFWSRRPDPEVSQVKREF